MRNFAIILFLITAISGLLVELGVLENKSANSIKHLDTDKCDLGQGICFFDDAILGRGSVEIFPRPILLNRRSQIKVVVSKDVISRLEVDFLGIEIPMGYIRPELKAKKANVYVGEVFLPTCIREQMTWKATLLFEIENELYAREYRFVTAKGQEVEE